MKLNEGLKKYKDLSRNEYFQKNQELSKNLWERENVPTVFDIAEFISGEHNIKMNKIFDFFDNKEEFIKMTNRTDSKYDQEESTNFIRKVMSSNNTEIAKAGYFYKLLMASADDFIIDKEDCKTNNFTIYVLNSLTEEIYNYRIKSMFAVELDSYCDYDYKIFIQNMKKNNFEYISIRTPLNCENAINHKICKKCSGILPKGIINVGTFTTLMVTEHSTQSALSSMNKGLKEDINDILSLKYDGAYDWEQIKLWIGIIVNDLINEEVQSRFYEIALISRVCIDKQGPFVSSLKGSINHSKNLFGSYIFKPNYKNFEKIVKQKEFVDNSLKLKIAMNDYK